MRTHDRWALLPVALLCLFGVSGCLCCAHRPEAAAAWRGTDMSNGLVTLKVVPEIGGRVIQYALGDHGFFWVNPALAGTVPPASGLGPDGGWLNYGGDKLWPAPQGWDSDQQWPGPPDAVLDGQPYALEIVDRDAAGAPTALRLTSRPDPRSGIRFSRVIRTAPDTTRVSIDATMANIDTKPRRWGIWAHTQLDAGNRHGRGYNTNFWAYCPMNPASRFPRGYDVLYGLVGEAAYQPDPARGLMRVHYLRRVGKIGLDSPAGWIATVDAADGYVFAQRFTYEQSKEYPELSSVEFWMNGAGAFIAWGKVNTMSEDPAQNPYVFESESLSPYAALQPGESAGYHYEWAAARIPPGAAVVACAEAGVTCAPLSAARRGGKLALAGAFGVFYRATATLVFLDGAGQPLGAGVAAERVGPEAPVDAAACRAWNGLAVPEAAAGVALELADSRGQPLGRLARAPLAP